MLRAWIHRLTLLAMQVGLATAAAAREDLLPVNLPVELHGSHATNGHTQRIDTPTGCVLRVTTLKKPPYPWNISLPIRTVGPIHAGDTLQLTFSARRLTSDHETGEAQIDCVVEESGGDHRKLSEASHSFTGEWSDISIPFRADQSLATGAAQVALRFGFAPQTAEVRDVALFNHGSDVDPSSLPKTIRRYPGFEADASWRRGAAERIERLRKADLEVEVTDTAGRPVPGAKVRAILERHAFALGSCVTNKRILGTGVDDDRYRNTLRAHFNKAVFENDLKWEPWEQGGAEHLARTQRAISWLRNHGFAIRGHVIVWPSWRSSPPWLKDLERNPEALRRAIEERVAGQTKALAGLLDEWDVVNENYAHTDFTDILGRGVLVDWFQIAARGSPGTRLFYNDYVMFQGEGPGSPSEALFTILADLKASGAPLAGIGEQGHFGGNPPGPEQVLAKLDRFAALGLPIQITEFDIDTADTDLQVAYTRDFLTAIFSHPAITGVMCWGFWEGDHWKPRAAFWDREWKLRPNGQVWVDLFGRQWHTDHEVVADATGRCRLKVFKGRLRIEASAKGAAATQGVVIDHDATARIVIE